MENIVTTGEVMDVAEDVIVANSGKVLKNAALVGLTLVVSGLTCKYVIIPVWKKITTKKEKAADESEESIDDQQNDE